MHLRRQLRVHALDLRLAEEPPAESDAVAAEIHDRTTARLCDVPEPGRVWAGVLLALLDQMDTTERAFVGHLFRLHVFRCEEQLLGVEQQHTRSAAGVDHRVGFLECDAQRLLADDVLAGLRRVDRDLRMQAVRGGDRDHLDVRIAEQVVVIGKGLGHAVALGELRRVTLGRRGDRHELGLFGDRLHGARDAIGLKAGTDDADFYFGHGAILLHHSPDRDAAHETTGRKLTQITDDRVTARSRARRSRF